MTPAREARARKRSRGLLSLKCRAWDAAEPIRRRLQPPPRRPGAVLAVQMAGIGNMVLFTPALAALRAEWPDARLVLLTSPSGGLGVVRPGGLVDEVWSLDLSGDDPRARAAMELRLAAAGFESVFCASRGWDIADILRRAGIPRRYGVRYPLAGVGVASTGYKWTASIALGASEHEVRQYARLVALGGLQVESVLGRSLRFDLSTEDFRAAHELLGGAARLPLVGIHHGSGAALKEKRWPLDRFVALGRRLARAGFRPVFVGGGEEAADLDAAGIDYPHVRAVGRLGLGPTAAVLSACRVAVGSDTGPMHIAAAVGTPVVAIFGPTHPSKNAPWGLGSRARVVQENVPCGPCYLPHSGRIDCAHDRECLRRIGLDAVLVAVLELAVRGRPRRVA